MDKKSNATSGKILPQCEVVKVFDREIVYIALEITLFVVIALGFFFFAQNTYFLDLLWI